MDAQVLPRQPGDPRRLGPYELAGRLGEGGMGVVFLGRERRGGRPAAVKVLRPELAGDPAFAARFRREVDAARRVDDPQVARVVDADPAATRPWLATEYVDGATLAATVAAGGLLAGEELVAFAAGVAQALGAIHAAGVVHRDLKPSNVLLQDRRVKVIDFGIAWAADATRTRSGLRFGTPSWMAPEQLRDRPAGPPADVFAWGILVAFAATGRHPFGGGPSEAVAYRILHDRPDLRGVPGPVRDLVRDALARDPAARPAAAHLAAVLAAAPPAPPPAATLPLTPALPPTAAGPARGRRAGRLLAAAALLAGLATTPQVVLAAVQSPAGPATAHPSRHCADDERREAAGKQRDHDDEEELEERDEKAPERDEEAQERDEAPERDEASGQDEEAREQDEAPEEARTARSPAPGAEVLGS